jgi:ribosomal protein L11 methyltransferase
MAEVLIAFAPYIGANLLDGGAIILSGILVERLSAVKQAYESAGFKVVAQNIKGEWSAIVVKKDVQ